MLDCQSAEKAENKDHRDIKIEEDLQFIVSKIHTDNRLPVNQYMQCTTSYNKWVVSNSYIMYVGTFR